MPHPLYSKDYKATKAINDYTHAQLVEYIKDEKPATFAEARYALSLSRSSPSVSKALMLASDEAGHTWEENRTRKNSDEYKKPAKTRRKKAKEKQTEIKPDTSNIFDLFIGKKKLVVLNVRGFIDSIGYDNGSEEAIPIRREIFKHIHASDWVNYEMIAETQLSNCVRTDQECKDALYVTGDIIDAIKLLRLANNEPARKRMKRICDQTTELKYITAPPKKKEYVLKPIKKEAIIALNKTGDYTPKGISKMLDVPEGIVRMLTN